MLKLASNSYLKNLFRRVSPKNNEDRVFQLQPKLQFVTEDHIITILKSKIFLNVPYPIFSILSVATIFINFKPIKVPLKGDNEQ